MWQRLCDLIDAAQDRRVLVVGDFMLDCYIYGDAERISPEAPVPVLRVVRREEALGGAGSVAANLAALGCVPHCVGVVGNDQAAETICNLLEATGADPSGLVRDSARPTTRKTRLVGLAQHRHRQQLIRMDDETTDPVGARTIADLIARIEADLDRCNVVCVEDYRKGVVSATLMARIVELARARSIPVLVDPAPSDDFSIYAGATLITPNRTETERVIGDRLMDLDAVRSAAGRIHAACHAEHVCVTLDKHGAALIGPGGDVEHIPTRARDVYDVTGAGDAVLAGIAVAVAAGGTLREAVALANVAGGIEVGKFGCVPITRDEIVEELLAEHHRDAGKIRTLDALVPELDRRRALGDAIVFTNGCFDLLHVGHVGCLSFCRQQGDIVVVGVNSDASVRRLNKGDGRPLVAEDDRAAILAALSDVDYVVLFDEDTPEALIRAVRPQVLVKGADYADKTVVGREQVEADGGRVALFPLVAGKSTTELLDRARSGGKPA